MPPRLGQLLRLLVERADGLDLAIKRLRIFGALRGQPIPEPMWFEIGLVLKNVPPSGGKSA